MHQESDELTSQKTEEDLEHPDYDSSTGSDTATADERPADHVAIVNFQPDELADPHNWTIVRCTQVNDMGFDYTDVSET